MTGTNREDQGVAMSHTIPRFPNWLIQRSFSALQLKYAASQDSRKRAQSAVLQVQDSKDEKSGSSRQPSARIAAA
jgi:hypothetical protein